MNELSGHALLAELERKKHDMIRVHNILARDFVLEYDTSRTNTPWVFPHKNKDQFGAGKGNRDVPLYIAERAMERMVDEQIEIDAAKEWEKKKKEYGTRDNIHKEEERHMTSFRRDESKRDEYRTQIWQGLVKRHGDTLKKREDRKPKESAIERLGLADRVVEQNVQDMIKELADESQTTKDI